jgi:cyclic pyranopterin phosphate synthase
MKETSILSDAYSRPLRDLRISVTDKCNFRCTYCMPFDEYAWISKKEILTFEEITRLAGCFASLGIVKIRLTGGEPLARRGLPLLIAKLSGLQGIQDLCLTTNGSLLADQVEALRSAGLSRINVSVDTLEPEKFRRITQRGELNRVLDGLFAAKRAGLKPIKINAVIERGVNDEDILSLVEFSLKHEFGIRFIEYMDVGNSNSWTSDKLFPKKEILRTIQTRYALREVGRENGSAPSVDYQLADGSGDIGVIASVTEPFCSSCTRARLTADGKLVTCLFSDVGHDLKSLLRLGADDDKVIGVLRKIWGERRDRYSDERLEALLSPKGYHAAERRKIEMISLGG